MQSKTSHEIIGSTGPRPAGPGNRGRRWAAQAGIFGAYMFLVAWGAAYLALFFLDRLPI